MKIGIELQTEANEKKTLLLCYQLTKKTKTFG